MLDLVAFDAGDYEVPAAVRFRAGEALADAARPPGGGLPRPGWPLWVQKLMQPVAASLAQAPSSQLRRLWSWRCTWMKQVYTKFNQTIQKNQKVYTFKKVTE